MLLACFIRDKYGYVVNDNYIQGKPNTKLNYN